MELHKKNEREAYAALNIVGSVVKWGSPAQLLAEIIVKARLSAQKMCKHFCSTIRAFAGMAV